mmetsp:Transcript_339/g.521  ORF Transcript_339/g.521 Transcript_339/m.521 type:complete len:184 (+) Transcript_339:1585-2136(+)
MAREGFRLLREAVRAARKCPEDGHRRNMLAYVRTRYESERDLVESEKIASALTRAKDEIEQMNYYHSLREQKSSQLRQTSADECSTGRGERIESRDLQIKINSEAKVEIEETTTFHCEQSKVNEKLIVLKSVPPFIGVSDVVEAVKGFGELRMVRCFESYAEVEFQHQKHADAAARNLANVTV